MQASRDTILAVSSPPGRSARGLIRASGPNTFELVDGLLEVAGPLRARGLRRARLCLWDNLSIACLALVFPGPHSYTGEDTIELMLPGNPGLLERVIDWLIERAGTQGFFARRAEAGEFTARAYLNGRMSLLEAESVNAVIAARSDAGLRAAELLGRGAVGDLGRGLAEELAAALALVEAGIDFTDQEDVIAIAPAELLDRLRAIRGRLHDHLARATPFEALEAIPWVVIAGPPNAGKSTLFNALLGRERTLVSPMAGTTRDVIAEPLPFDAENGVRRELMLVDIAGLDAGDQSFLSVEMQAAAARALQRAELILHCIPADECAGSPAVSPARSTRELSIITKCDLAAGARSAHPADSIRVSGLSGAGLAELRRAIADRLADRGISLAGDALALLPRHEAALRNALHNLDEAIERLAPQALDRALAQPEIFASLMRLALDELSGLAGAVTADDILGRIFAGFCIGK